MNTFITESWTILISLSSRQREDKSGFEADRLSRLELDELKLLLNRPSSDALSSIISDFGFVYNFINAFLNLKALGPLLINPFFFTTSFPAEGVLTTGFARCARESQLLELDLLPEDKRRAEKVSVVSCNSSLKAENRIYLY